MTLNTSECGDINKIYVKSKKGLVRQSYPFLVGVEVEVEIQVEFQNAMFCTIWKHLYNLKTMKNNNGRVLLLVKLQAKACNFTKSNNPPWVFSRF